MNKIQVILAGYLYSGFGLCPGCDLLTQSHYTNSKIRICH